MGSSSQFHEVFAAEPGAAEGVTFARFMELAMYHPRVGYYTRDRRRVGRDKAADFFTATTFNPIFGELVVAATIGLLAPAEPGGGVLRDIAHPFAGYRMITYGQPFEFPPRAVVFSNELFDAQPFHRVVHRGPVWRELGVALRDGKLREVEMPDISPELAAWADRLPPAAPEDYHIDLPLRAVPLLERIVGPDWSGLFLAFDYGKTWRELAENIPGGTGRTYSHQKMGGDLLARPGEVDLTCHVCWDWLVDTLQQNRFGEALVESHEVFFTRRATARLAEIVAAEAGKHTLRKRFLLTLLHPGNMGQKFQALHALRSPA